MTLPQAIMEMLTRGGWVEIPEDEHDDVAELISDVIGEWLVDAQVSEVN